MQADRGLRKTDPPPRRLRKREYPSAYWSWIVSIMASIVGKVIATGNKESTVDCIDTEAYLTAGENDT